MCRAGVPLHTMRIAVNTRFLLSGKLEGLGWYTHEIMRRMVLGHPEDEFVFFFDRPFDPQFVYAHNVTPVVAPPPARHPVLWYLWFEWALPVLLRRHEPDVFFSPDGYCSLSTRVPTLMTLHDIIPLHHPEQVPWAPRVYYRHFLPRYVRRADHIVTVSEHVRSDVVRTCGADPKDISVVYNGIRAHFRPLPAPEQQAVRDRFSAGKPYFLYTGAIHPRKNVDTLIRAFDAYKQAAPGDAQLLLAGRFAWQTGPVKAAYESALHQQDIHFLGYVPDEVLPGLYAAALALVNLSGDEGFGLPLAEAMACGTPVIASDIPAFREVGGEACVWVDHRNTAAVANALQQMAQQPALRAYCTQTGLARAPRFSWDAAAEALYALIKTA